MIQRYIELPWVKVSSHQNKHMSCLVFFHGIAFQVLINPQDAEL